LTDHDVAGDWDGHKSQLFSMSGYATAHPRSAFSYPGLTKRFC